jgi:hypothetical protein
MGAMVVVLILSIMPIFGNHPPLRVDPLVRRASNGHVVISVISPEDRAKLEKAFYWGVKGGDRDASPFQTTRASLLYLTFFSTFLSLFVIFYYGRRVESRSGSLLFLILLIAPSFLGFHVSASGQADSVRLIGGSAYLSAILSHYGICLFLERKKKKIHPHHLSLWLMTLSMSFLLSTIRLGFPKFEVSYEGTPWIGIAIGALSALVF